MNIRRHIVPCGCGPVKNMRYSLHRNWIAVIFLLQIPVLIYVYFYTVYQDDLHRHTKRKKDERLEYKENHNASEPQLPHITGFSRNIRTKIRNLNRITNDSNVLNSGFAEPPLLSKIMKEYEKNWLKELTIYGEVRRTRGFLTIGIPVVKRRVEGKNYILTTLQSLISGTTQKDRNRTTVVVFLSDFNTTWNKAMSLSLYNKFVYYVKSHFLQIVHCKRNIYPNFKNASIFPHEPSQRVIWRSKQNIDYSYLMLYCRTLSRYYMQLEDDVIVAKKFLQHIEKAVQVNMQTQWIFLEFSSLGFIGKLFRSVDLEQFALYILTLYNVMPCDLLLFQYRILHNQRNPIRAQNGIFQHIGKVSSLPGKMIPAVDNTYINFGEEYLSETVPNGDNPHADIQTNMVQVQGFLPIYAYIYNNRSLYFCAKNLRAHSYFRIVYDNALNISRISVSTGSPKTKANFLRTGIVMVGVHDDQCRSRMKVGAFYYGEFDSYIQGFRLPPNIMCISIESTKMQPGLMILRKISVLLKALK